MPPPPPECQSAPSLEAPHLRSSLLRPTYAHGSVLAGVSEVAPEARPAVSGHSQKHGPVSFHSFLLLQVQVRLFLGSPSPSQTIETAGVSTPGARWRGWSPGVTSFNHFQLWGKPQGVWREALSYQDKIYEATAEVHGQMELQLRLFGCKKY